MLAAKFEDVRAEGITAGKAEIAKNLLILHTLALEGIAKVTGLKTDELKKLKEELISD